jgi:hypothetical protein
MQEYRMGALSIPAYGRGTRVSCCMRSDTEIGIAWMSKVTQQELPSFSLMLIDIQKGSIIHAASYYPACERLDSLHLIFDTRKNRWFITTVEAFQDRWPSRLVLYLLHADTLKLVETPMTLDEATDIGILLGPVLDVTVDGGDYTIVYMKPQPDEIEEPLVCFGRVTETHTPNHLLREELAHAEKAQARIANGYGLLLSCNPEYGEFSEKADEAPFSGSTAEWRFSLTGWSHNQVAAQWEESLKSGLPVGNRATPDVDFEWLMVDAEMIGATATLFQQETVYVVGMVMMDTFDDTTHRYSLEEEAQRVKTVERLMCIGTDGKVLGVCQEAIGLQLHFCSCHRGIIGSDIQEGHRRLWRWSIDEDIHFSQVRWLDQHVKRVSMVGGQEGVGKECQFFWLVEEYENHLNVSKCDTTTLEQIDAGISLENVHLLSKQEHWRALDRGKPMQMCSSQDSLLFVAVDDQSILSLYQIE